MSSLLFEPITLAGMTLPNRIAVAPMCQYSADNGTMNDWHIANAGSFARSGPGLIILEASGVEAAGRITHGCAGLYSDENEAAMARVVAFCKSVGHSKIGVQLAHAGRKASTQRPWEGGSALSDGAWQTYAPSAMAFEPSWHTPQALDDDGLARIKQAFVSAAKRALRIDMDVIELHAAHGYLLHQFLSPLSNQRMIPMADRWTTACAIHWKFLTRCVRYGQKIGRCLYGYLPVIGSRAAGMLNKPHYLPKNCKTGAVRRFMSAVVAIRRYNRLLSARAIRLALLILSGNASACRGSLSA